LVYRQKDQLNVYKKNNQYLLIKNNKFNFLKNLNIFPMDQLNNPKNFDKDLNFKISNMNMNIKIEYKKKYNLDKNINWINPTKLQNYVLPTFTKKIIKFLESQK
jgi:A/G-specific adenine glycosylase